MKVALVTDKFIYGGGLEHIYQLCKGLPEIEFGVFGKRGYAEHKFKELKNVTLFFDYSKKMLYNFNPDWVHIHHLRPLMKLYNINLPTIFTVHGVHSHKFEFHSGIRNFINKNVRLIFEGYLYKKVDKLLFVSKEDESFVKGLYPGLKCTKTIYNGTDFNAIDVISKSKSEIRFQFGYDTNKKNILTVARFNFQKGYDILQSSLSKIDKNLLKKFHFYFIGDGPLLDEQKKLNKVLGLQDNITFLGKKSNVIEYMKASDYFLLPSRWEGLPITLIEALCCNLPILGSDTYGIREVCGTFPSNSVLVDFTNYTNLESVLEQCLTSSISSTIDRTKLEVTFGLNQMLEAIKKVYRND